MKNKWENSSWGRKLIVQKKRASLNDFDRFKIMLAKINVSILFQQFDQMAFLGYMILFHIVYLFLLILQKAGVVRQELSKLKKQTA